MGPIHRRPRRIAEPHRCGGRGGRFFVDRHGGHKKSLTKKVFGKIHFIKDGEWVNTVFGIGLILETMQFLFGDRTYIATNQYCGMEQGYFFWHNSTAVIPRKMDVLVGILELSHLGNTLQKLEILPRVMNAERNGAAVFCYRDLFN